jgi:plastocyanin
MLWRRVTVEAMALRNLVVVALAICAVAGVLTAVADKGTNGGVASVAKAKTPPAKKKVASHAFHGRTVYVTMRRLKFSPGTIHVRVGDRVVWRNRDNVGHNVTTQEDAAATSRVDLASPTIKPGGAFAYVARYAGSAHYVCTIHPTTMHATIVVSRRS